MEIDQTLDSPKPICQQKILKIARLVNVDKVVLNFTNTDLLMANI